MRFNRKGGFIDVGKLAGRPYKGTTPPGYIGRHAGREEYWVTDRQFETIAGGKAEARDLKRELKARKLLSTERRGNRFSYVVKREIRGKRTFVVAIRAKKVV